MAGYFTFFLLIFLVNYSNVSNANKLNISFFLITLFVGLRYGIGFDYFSYYQIIQDNNLETEPIPRMLIDVAHNTHFSVFFFITSLWTGWLFPCRIKKDELLSGKYALLYLLSTIVMRQFWVGPPSNGLFSHFLSDVPSRFQDEKENTIHSLGFFVSLFQCDSRYPVIAIKENGEENAMDSFYSRTIRGRVCC